MKTGTPVENCVISTRMQFVVTSLLRSTPALSVLHRCDYSTLVNLVATHRTLTYLSTSAFTVRQVTQEWNVSSNAKPMFMGMYRRAKPPRSNAYSLLTIDSPSSGSLRIREIHVRGRLPTSYHEISRAFGEMIVNVALMDE